MAAEADGASEDDLLREESTPGPTDTGSMFAALLQEMKKMNENILVISEPAESSEGSPERDNNRDLTQQDGWKTQDGRMTYKNTAQDQECTVSRNNFSSFYRPESSSRPVA